MFIQIIILIVLLVIGIFVFKNYPFKANVKDLTLSAIFIVLAAVLKRFSIMVPLFGFPSLQIGFETLPLIMSGMLLSPSYAFLIGLSLDLIGLIVAPTSFPFLGFTLNSILRPLIPSLWMSYQHKFNEKKVILFLYIGLILLAVGSSLYVFSLETITVSKEVITITNSIKMSTMILCLSVSVIMIILCQLLRKKLNARSSSDLINWTVMIVVLEISINFCLTPLWLQVMYGIPWLASLLVRILKACVMVPLNIVIGYSCYEMIKKAIH